MPLVDGIGILRYAAQMEKPPLTVAISGYHDFAYAREALKYRAKNYLLKPVDKQELAKLLAELERECGDRAEEEKRRALRDVLYGQGIGERVQELFRPVYPIYLVAGPFLTDNTEEGAPGNEYWRTFDLKPAADELLGGGQEVFCFFGKNLNEKILLLEERVDQELAVSLRRLEAALPRTLPVTLAYGPPVADIGRIQDALNELRRKIRREVVFGESGVMSAGEEKEAKTYALPVPDQRAFQHAVSKGQAADMERILQEIRRDMKTAGITQYELESALKKLFLIVATGRMQRDDVKEEWTFLDIPVLLSYAVNLDDFSMLVRNMVCAAEPEEGRLLMKQVDEYIISHIRQPVTTKLLAARFGLVSPYLSKLFKEYKGRTPSQYIQDIRLDSAKELLVKYPDLMNKDIAEMVGYSDPLYFSKAFKKNVGVYPSEYRSAGTGKDKSRKQKDQAEDEGQDIVESEVRI